MMPQLYKKVIELATLADKLQEVNPKLTRIEAIQLACKIERDVKELGN